MRIVFLDSYTTNPGDLNWQPLADLGDFIHYEHTEESLIIERSQNAEILIVNKCVLTQSVMDQLPNLKCICVAATGYNNVDIQYARIKNIDVCNVKGYSTHSVAQHVVALILHIYNDVGRLNELVQEGIWSKSREFCFWRSPLQQLYGKTIGIVGLGQIGVQLSNIALAFGMNVLAIDRSKKIKKQDVHYTDEKTLFRSSDIISLHMPFNTNTKEYINSEKLNWMKNSAILINTGRGGLMDQLALANALKQSKIRAAGLDVLENEPPSQSNPLIGLDNCYITPHVAWATVQARLNLIEGLAENIVNFIKNKPSNVVN